MPDGAGSFSPVGQNAVDRLRRIDDLDPHRQGTGKVQNVDGLNRALSSEAGDPLRYTFVADAADLTINDVARDVIGNARDSFGDLHNMELDVELVGGSGSVLPFLQTIDNGSGDSVVRTD